MTFHAIDHRFWTDHSDLLQQHYPVWVYEVLCSSFFNDSKPKKANVAAAGGLHDSRAPYLKELYIIKPSTRSVLSSENLDEVSYNK
jgi:hypothetical protein